MKRIIIILALIFITSSLLGRSTPADSIKTALLIVDIQDFYFPGDGPGLINAQGAAQVASKVLSVFRERTLTVVHVKHQAAKGSEIHKSVEPIEGEKVIPKRAVNSFQGTDLLDYLRKNNITRLVIIGMQTHMCLEAAVRAGHDYGFQCVVIKDACATKDLKFDGITIKAEDVHNSTFATLTAGGYSKVIDFETFQKDPDNYLIN
jgi:nicotinamidase-related amidase